MKEKRVDYSATLIYKITCKDPTVTDLYVGHTTNFVQRRDQHKQSSVNSDGKLYNFIRNNGAFYDNHSVDHCKLATGRLILNSNAVEVANYSTFNHASIKFKIIQIDGFNRNT